MTHRISLRGPWTLRRTESLSVEVKRRFHAPSNSNNTLDSSTQATKSQSMRIYFRWMMHPDWMFDTLRFNGKGIPEAMAGGDVGASGLVHFFERQRGDGVFEVSEILLPFNEIVFIWNDLSQIESLEEGRYTPSSSHLFHFDSWLEIQEAPR